MNAYFTIMLKENDTSNMKLLTEKLSEGFWVNDRIEVGRSTVLTLRKTVYEDAPTLTQFGEADGAIDPRPVNAVRI